MGYAQVSGVLSGLGIQASKGGTLAHFHLLEHLCALVGCLVQKACQP